MVSNGSNSVEITLPYPPSTNHLYRSFIRGGKICRAATDENEKFHAAVSGICRLAGYKPFGGDITLTIHVYRPRRDRDLTNCVKALEDALKGYTWHDDKQVTECHLFRHDDPLNPRAVVTVTETAPAPPPAPLSKKTRAKARDSPIPRQAKVSDEELIRRVLTKYRK